MCLNCVVDDHKTGDYEFDSSSEKLLRFVERTKHMLAHVEATKQTEELYIVQ